MDKEISGFTQDNITAAGHSVTRSQSGAGNELSADACSAAVCYPQKELAEFNYFWRCIDDIYHDLARKAGLSDSALIILYALHTLGDGSLQRDICRQASVSKQTIHSSIHNLERDGFLWLETGGRDKRIWLTEKGKELIHYKIAPIVALENAAFTALGPEKSMAFLRLNGEFVQLLRKLADGFSIPES